MARNYVIDVMLVGATGAGKSSTINALMGNSVSKVGYGADPETMKIRAYRMNKNLRLWDTPGLGDSPEADKEHIQKIKSLLNTRFDCHGKKYGRLIDTVLVIVDGSHRDIGTLLNLVKENIYTEINPENVFFAINQADMAMHGHHFDKKKSIPDEILLKFLTEQALSVKKRMEESTGKKIRLPSFYSAQKNYNLGNLLDSVIYDSKWRKRKYLLHRPIYNSLFT